MHSDKNQCLNLEKSHFLKILSSRTIQYALYPEILEYFKSLYAFPMISSIIEAVSESFEAAPVSFKSLTGLTLSELSISQEIIETLKKLQCLTKFGLSRFEFNGDLWLNDLNLDTLIMLIDRSKKIGPRITPPNTFYIV
jgi:hypothetical protein